MADCKIAHLAILQTRPHRKHHRLADRILRYVAVAGKLRLPNRRHDDHRPLSDCRSNRPAHLMGHRRRQFIRRRPPKSDKSFEVRIKSYDILEIINLYGIVP